jgi:hypothetical protein
MAGPLTGTWKASLSGLGTYVGAAKWGTGVNPIHSVWGGDGRDTAPGYDTEPDRGLGGLMPYPPSQPVPESLLEQSGEHQYPVADEWGYGTETGTEDRPEWGGEEDWRASAEDYPSWGMYPTTGGAWVRSQDHGSANMVTQKLDPNESVSEGWLNKPHSTVLDARTSDPSQYEMQTSMTQRDKTRAGSQRSGTLSDFMAPIKSRITGRKMKVYSGGQRHVDMFPYQQSPTTIRPFVERQAGTGYREWLAANDAYASVPYQREPAPDPNPGDFAGNSTQPDSYISEDVYY